MKALNHTLGLATPIEETVSMHAEGAQLQSKGIHRSIEKQPMTLKEVFSKMHWIQDTKKKAS